MSVFVLVSFSTFRGLGKRVGSGLAAPQDSSKRSVRPIRFPREVVSFRHRMQEAVPFVYKKTRLGKLGLTDWR
jgi:hypothetical protein